MGGGGQGGMTQLLLVPWHIVQEISALTRVFLPAPFLLLLLPELIILPSDLKFGIQDLPTIAVFLYIKIKAY